MRQLARLIFNRWVLGAIGIVLFSIIIWWGFPTIAINNVHPFESETIRWIQIAIIVLTPVGRIGWRFVNARRANAALMGGLLQHHGGAAVQETQATAMHLAQASEHQAQQISEATA